VSVEPHRGVLIVEVKSLRLRLLGRMFALLTERRPCTLVAPSKRGIGSKWKRTGAMLRYWRGCTAPANSPKFRFRTPPMKRLKMDRARIYLRLC
jgi:hypothetical protein